MDKIIINREDLEKIVNDAVKVAVRDAFMENAQKATELDGFYTVKELAEKWRMSVQCIWRHVKLGHISPVRIGKRLLFPKDVINSMGCLRYARMGDKGPVIID